MASEIDDPKGFAIWRLQTVRKLVQQREQALKDQRDMLDARQRTLEREQRALAEMESDYKKMFGEDPPRPTY